MTKRTWDKEAERRRKFELRQKKRLEEKDAGMPWENLLGEEREQAIRDHFGYAASETRTQAERQAAADRIVQNPQVVEAVEVAEKIWATHGAGAEAERQAKYENLRESLIAKGVKNVPVDFAQDVEARARRAAAYAEWRQSYLAENPE